MQSHVAERAMLTTRPICRLHILLSVYSIRTLPNHGMSDCASVNENTSFGPVTSTLGVRPLKKAEKPSFLIMSRMIATPPTFDSKFAFWMRVLTTSSGAATVILAMLPLMLATKFCSHVASE